jgi:photosystem II stability/assembly factor-like uncharacterized protein
MFRLCLLTALALLQVASCGPAEAMSDDLFSALQWRLIGPFRGGRTIAVAGVPGDPTTFYFGAVGGGVWKTTDGGTVWQPIFDAQPVASIGAIAVAPSNPSVLYVGTGEADLRSDLALGKGMYKSTDAGKTWTSIGLGETGQIGRIVVHPKNPDIVYVAALGHAYGPNGDRGVYRSIDGGGHWTKALDLGPDVGVVDLALVPDRPDTLYATGWQARREPWTEYAPSQGAGSGLYKSTDAGRHWTRLQGKGLPTKQWGRAGVAVASGLGGKRVYALIGADDDNGLYRSDNAGESWVRVGTDRRITSRSWYFGRVTVDPQHPDTVYLPNVGLYRSTDGGKNFDVLRGAPGGDDYHLLWVDPTDSAHMILATDQGATISLDAGKTWSTWYNQPTGQFYHVITDNQFPYTVYGSQQDSGSATVPSRTDHGQITEYDRGNVGDGESGYIAPDPRDPNIVYVNNTYGTLYRFDRRTSQTQDVTPWLPPSAVPGSEVATHPLRFPWTSPLVFSPSEPNTLYYGAQMLLKTLDGGLTWSAISPDLTGDTRVPDPQAKVTPPTIETAKSMGYGVLWTVAPSPLDAGIIWTGSDTGLVHLTRDGGKSWVNVTPAGLRDWSKVTHIEASHFDPAVAYAAIDRHELDDPAPVLYRTQDFGQTWALITDGLSPQAFVNAVREDPVRRGLLFAATEQGVFASFDDGGHWQSLQANLPMTSVRDLVVHGDDLAAATHGRAFWILDDIGPLREASPEIAAAEGWLYRPALALRLNSSSFLGTPLPPEIPAAKNPPAGAVIDYVLKEAPKDEVVLEILDVQQQVTAHFSNRDKPVRPAQPQAIADRWLPSPPPLPAQAGMNRFVWNLHATPPQAPGGEAADAPPQGPLVVPGTYQIRLTANGKSYTQPLTVGMDPRSTASPDDLAQQWELSRKAASAMDKCTAILSRVAGLRTQSAALKEQSDKVTNQELSAALADFQSQLKRMSSATDLSGLAYIRAEVTAVLDAVQSADRRPTAQAMERFASAERKLAMTAQEWEAMTSRTIPNLNAALAEQHLVTLKSDE